MPNVTATPKGTLNGEVVTEFTDTTSTAAVTYTYPVSQAGIMIENSGVADIYVTLGSYTDQVINPNKKWKADVSFTSLSIRSDINSQEFTATAYQNDVEGSGIADHVGRTMAQAEFDKRGLNVQRYGAKGDDVTDDTDAFRNTLNAISQGGTIFVPKGTYIVDGLDITKSNVTLHIAKGATLKLKNNAVVGWVISIMANDVTIEGEGTIDGNSANNNGTETKGIRIDALTPQTSFSNITIRGVEIKNIPGEDGIYITGNTFQGYTVQNVDIESCHIHNTGRAGIVVVDGKDIRIFKNLIEDLTLASTGIAIDFEANIETEQQISDVEVFNNRIKNVIGGVDCMAQNCTIENNRFMNVTGNGVLLNKAIKGTVITENRFTNIGGVAIKSGLEQTSAANDDLIITDNTFNTVTSNAIKIWGYYNQVNDNKFINIGAVPVYMYGAYCTFDGNVFKNCAGSAIENLGRSVFSGNQISACGAIGIKVLAIGSNAIVGNFFQHESTDTMITAIDLTSTGANTVIGNNHRNITRMVLNQINTDRITENVGQSRDDNATINASTTSVVVTHGLNIAPTKFALTAQGNVGNLWVSNITSTQFTINCSTAPASNVPVTWEAKY